MCILQMAAHLLFKHWKQSLITVPPNSHITHTLLFTWPIYLHFAKYSFALLFPLHFVSFHSSLILTLRSLWLPAVWNMGHTVSSNAFQSVCLMNAWRSHITLWFYFHWPTAVRCVKWAIMMLKRIQQIIWQEQEKKKFKIYRKLTKKNHKKNTKKIAE